MQREGAHVAPEDHRVPGDPVGDPRERVAHVHPVHRVDQHRQPESVHRVAVPEERERGGHERRPEEEGGDHHPAPRREERPELEADGIAEQLPHGDDRAGRDQGRGQNPRRHHHVARRLAEEHGSRPDGRGAIDLGEPLRPLLHQRLHGVEEEQDADEQAQGVELTRRHRSRGQEQRRIEWSEREERLADGLVEDQRDEEVHPRANRQLPNLGPADRGRRGQESRRVGLHGELAEGSPGRDRSGFGNRGRRLPAPAPAEADHQRVRVSPKEPAGGVARRRFDCEESGAGKRDAAEQESGVRRQRRGVVEVEAPVQLQEGLVQPPESRGVREHERAVDRRVEPARRPADEKPQDDQQRGDREGEDHDGTAGPGAEEERHAREEHDLGKAEKQGRDQVVPGNERSDLRGVRPGRQEVVEAHGRAQEQAPDDQEGDHRSGETAPHVLPDAQPG